MQNTLILNEVFLFLKKDKNGYNLNSNNWILFTIDSQSGHLCLLVGAAAIQGGGGDEKL